MGDWSVDGGMGDEESPQTKKLKWMPVKISTGVILQGGWMHNARGSTGVGLNSVEIAVKGRSVEFILVQKTQWWLAKVVGGEGHTRSACKESVIVETIRAQLKTSTAASVEAALDPPTSILDKDASDPMKQLKQTPTAKDKQKRAESSKRQLSKTRAKNQISVATVPAEFGDTEKTRDVTVMLNNRSQLFLDAKDIPWLCTYIATELHGGAVPEPHDPDDDPPNDGTDDGSAVAGLRCEWSPNGSWRAVLTRGPLKGKDYVTFVRDMTEAKWMRGATLLGIQTSYREASRAEKKEVLMAWLEDTVREKIKEATAALGDADGGTGS